MDLEGRLINEGCQCDKILRQHFLKVHEFLNVVKVTTFTTLFLEGQWIFKDINVMTFYVIIF